MAACSTVSSLNLDRVDPVIVMGNSFAIDHSFVKRHLELGQIVSDKVEMVLRCRIDWLLISYEFILHQVQSVTNFQCLALKVSNCYLVGGQ